MTVAGVLFTGVGVAFMRLATLGMDPWQTLMGGIAAVFAAIPFGLLWIPVSLLLLLVALVFKRSLIGIGTVLNLALLGYVIDWSHRWLLDVLPTGNLLGRIGYLMIALLILCITAALYFTANMGVSPYDAVALILAERKPRMPFKYWRVLCDSSCLILGVTLFLAAGRPTAELTTLAGPGTVAVALGMGPLIDFFADRIAKPLLNPPTRSACA